MDQRTSGILLHISSLPSPFGVGDFGPDAYRFADFLFATKQSYWQILPLNPTDAINGHSPYSSFSAFAINTLFISPEGLVQEGLLEHSDLAQKPFFPAGKVDYKEVVPYKKSLFDKAFKHFSASHRLYADFKKFCEQNDSWLKDYAIFIVINEQLSNEVWTNWPQGLRNREKKVLDDFQKQFAHEIEQTKFCQFIAFRQWMELKAYCGKKNIKIIGDVPIYVTFDSADVWTHPENYKLDDNKEPTVVAGVPPDYFSKTGQRWGNPVYQWETLKASGFAWWIERLQHNLKIFDVIRIDHFRGLVQYWEIPASEPTAVNGRWASVPVDDFLSTLQRRFHPLPIIAEDLGIITDDVREVMKKFQLPGMKILLFAFGGDRDKHPYLPHNYGRNCVVYTGTHDNNTAVGWYRAEASREEREHLKQYIGKAFNEDEIHWGMVDLAFNSQANIAIIPMQDILGLGSEARMNKPATIDGNWRWRLLPDAITKRLIQQLTQHTEDSQRVFQPILG